MPVLLSILAVAALWGGSPQAQAPAPVAAQAASDYVFPSGAGMLFFYVRPDRAPDFEAVVAKLDAALRAAPDPVRREQAAAWRTYQSLERQQERLYIFLFDPAVRDASYDPVRLLSELLPAEVGDLYAQLKASIIRVERMALQRK
jgi:hypothetical protein